MQNANFSNFKSLYKPIEIRSIIIVKFCFQLALDFVSILACVYQILKELTSNRRMQAHWDDLSFQHVLDTMSLGS